MGEAGAVPEKVQGIAKQIKPAYVRRFKARP
jgi:hypothetical protein